MEKVYNSHSSSGKANFGWLNANYSFSFTNFNQIQFRLPGALNHAVTEQGKGFVTLPQEKMNIIALPLPGSFKIPGFHVT